MPDEPNSLGDFQARFQALAVEAQSYGISSVYAVHDGNPIGDSEEFLCGWQGGKFLALGLLFATKEAIHRGPGE